MEVLTLQEQMNIRSNVCRTCMTERTCTLVAKGRTCRTVQQFYAAFVVPAAAQNVSADHMLPEVPYGKCVDPELQRVLDVERENDFKKLDDSLARIAAEDACDICQSDACQISEDHEAFCAEAARFGIKLV